MRRVAALLNEEGVMPLEIEIKLAVEGHEGVRGRLVALKAERKGVVREVNMFFDRADGSLRRADSGLRVRVTRGEGAAGEEGKALLTFKGPAGAEGLKSREAFDLTVGPEEQVVPFLRGLGFEQVLMFEKDRETWMLEGCHVELDRLPQFGCFVEIEGPSEGRVKGVQARLGLEGVEAEGRSYSQMVGDFLRGNVEMGFELRF